MLCAASCQRTKLSSDCLSSKARSACSLRLLFRAKITNGKSWPSPATWCFCAIGHLPLSGSDGLLQQFSGVGRGRRVLIHINNTNPILDEESAEYRQVREMGWEIAHDGMEFAL